MGEHGVVRGRGKGVKADFEMIFPGVRTQIDGALQNAAHEAAGVVLARKAFFDYVRQRALRASASVQRKLCSASGLCSASERK